MADLICGCACATHLDVARLAREREQPQLLLLGLVQHRRLRVQLGHLNLEALLCVGGGGEQATGVSWQLPLADNHV